ncbi:MAG: ATP-binding protein [Candidatus Melainabacteria bacterium]|nr:ATP-binding protein [Candidatus Melainabacteria bacterium]
MQYLERSISLPGLLKLKSVFLFGPRATGKTTLIHHQLPAARVYDLLDYRVFSRLLRNPHLLEEENLDSGAPIVIDEIQKLPHLLDEVHRLIAKHHWKFLLTGSSARKLKRGAANLLAGRAWMAQLLPLTYCEIPDFDLSRYLNRGGLPSVYFSENPDEELDSYVALYLKEEIQAESITRSLPAFAAFLDAIAVSNGEEINLESFARDCGVSPMTVKNYIQILEDTLIGFSLNGFTKTKKRKGTARIKHYLFDVGVVNTLAQRGEIKPKSELFGKAFEQYIAQELRAYLSYSRSKHKMTYWRSTSHHEVDFLIGQTLAVEVKATDNVYDSHLRGLRALKEEGLVKHFAVVSLDRDKRTTRDGIMIYPWEVFLKKLWKGEILSQ